MTYVFHEYYPFDLSALPDEIKRHEFAKMLGTPEIVLVGVLGAGLPELHDAVCRFNDAQARAVAGTQADTWLRLKVVVWRGSWCVRASFQRNKRRKLHGPPGPELLGTLPVQLGPELVTLHPLGMSIRAMTRPAFEALGGIGRAEFAAMMGMLAPGARIGFVPEAQRYAKYAWAQRPEAPEHGFPVEPRRIGYGFAPLERSRNPLPEQPKAHPFGDTYGPRRGGKAARKMQRRARR